MTADRIHPADIRTRSLTERASLLDLGEIMLDPDAPPPPAGPLEPKLDDLASRIRDARNNGSPVMLAYGAHLVKNGCGRLLGRLIETGWVTHLATQGAGIIHDWELAYTAKTSESVRDNAPVGRFGCWEETGRAINLAVLLGGLEDLGFGQSIGRWIERDGGDLPDPDDLARQIANDPGHPLAADRARLLSATRRLDLPPGRLDMPHSHKDVSIPAACFRAGANMTVHPGIGYDIFACHPMFDAGALGAAAGRDFHAFTRTVMDLDGGVYLSVGSAIMSPQVFEKAFSLANNLRLQQGLPALTDHHIAIVDIQDGGGWEWSTGEPPPDHPAYYLRFCKSFYRMGGSIDYLQTDNRLVLAHLVHRLCRS